jgi:hypothetical protein
MHEDEHNEAFELPLPQGSPLQQRIAQLDRLEPPPELDDLVLSRAREAIRAPAPMPYFQPPRWALPFGLAATVVVGCALVLAVRAFGTHLSGAPPGTPRAAAGAVMPAALHAARPTAPTTAPTAAPTAAQVAVTVAGAPAVAPAAAQQWARHIARLRSQGKTAEAEREWTALLARYPELRQNAAPQLQGGVQVPAEAAPPAHATANERPTTGGSQ